MLIRISHLQVWLLSCLTVTYDERPVRGTDIQVDYSGIHIQRLECLAESCRSLVTRPRLVNTPPAKAGRFGLRLKAGLIGHSANYPLLPQAEAWGERSEGPGINS